MNIKNMIRKYRNEGYAVTDAESKTAQDIILLKISKSKFKEHITIKGGVVMHSISKNKRRATRDLDLDFIKYSLDNVDDGIYISIDGDIKPLHHQDYDGKRVFIKIKDEYNNELNTKIDIGVHKFFDIEQDDYLFMLDAFDKSVSLLINSKEQIFTEKLKSLLKLGVRSTRYKDLFDFFYLINSCNMNKIKLIKSINTYIYNAETMRENNIQDIYDRLSKVLNSNLFKNNLNSPKVNWLDISIEEAINSVLNYLEELSGEIITV